MYTSHYIFSCIYVVSEDCLLGLYSSLSFLITQEKMQMPLYSLYDLEEKLKKHITPICMDIRCSATDESYVFSAEVRNCK